MKILILLSIIGADGGTETYRWLKNKPSIPPQAKFNPARPETTNSFGGCRSVVILRKDGKHITLPCENGEMQFFVEEDR